MKKQQTKLDMPKPAKLVPKPTMTGALLFKKVKVAQQSSIFFSFFGDASPLPEEAQPDILSFLGEIKSPEELTALVRQDPLAKYFLVKGQMVEVNVALPVFVDGKNIELHNEWI